MGTGDILLGVKPAMDKHPVQEGVVILLGTLHAAQTVISFGRMGFWLCCAFTLPFYRFSYI